MLPHWEIAIEPLLSGLDSGPIVEIGAATGDTTAALARLARERGFVLHSVDPAPQFDSGELEAEFGKHFRFHRERSHDALEDIGPAAAVLIDGDHNWYTVQGELIRLEQAAAQAACPFPLVVLHDVEWPYGRRDMYYEPEAIPAEWRRPWAHKGIEWGSSELVDSGGINAEHANAIEEGGPRNGVLTAVEDFLSGRARPTELRIVPGDCGLGIVASEDFLVAHPQVRPAWEALRSPEFLLTRAEQLATTAASLFARWTKAMERNTHLSRELEEMRRNESPER